MVGTYSEERMLAWSQKYVRRMLWTHGVFFGGKRVTADRPKKKPNECMRWGDKRLGGGSNNVFLRNRGHVSFLVVETKLNYGARKRGAILGAQRTDSVYRPPLGRQRKKNR